MNYNEASYLDQSEGIFLILRYTPPGEQRGIIFDDILLDWAIMVLAFAIIIGLGFSIRYC